jgi:hypothetical protein
MYHVPQTRTEFKSKKLRFFIFFEKTLLLMLEYLRPDNLEYAFLTLIEQPCTLPAGGTDFYPANKKT